jgi:heavy metal translocating P-type ATPase
VDGYLDSLSMLVTLLLAGRVAEARGRRHATAAASAIASGLPTTARVERGAAIETIPVDQLVPGDLVEVGLGEEVPADGVVVRGSARVALALLTGESDPVDVGAGDAVVAGAPVLDGALTVRVERVGEQTLGRRMAAEVLASVDRPLLPTPADRLAPAFTAFALVASVGTLAVWTYTSGLNTGIERMAAVLVVACPCALGLSWPIAVSAGLGALARRGVVLRGGEALQRLAKVDVIALDKTGTVTGGAPVVVAADDEVLRIAAGLERASTHPIAAAIRKAAIERGIPLPAADQVREEAGVGVTGVVDGATWSLRTGGPGEVHLHGDGVVGRITFRDVQRSDATDVVGRLRRRARVALLTGDHPEVAERLAAQIHVDEWRARTTPQDKAEWIAARQAEGHGVLFVGDGLNDGPALVKADVGLVMHTGAAASVLAADGIVLTDGLGPVLAAMRVADVVRSTVRGNLIRSLVYNLTAVTAAALGYVDPLVAAVLMPASSLMVLWGGLRVERRTRNLEEAKWTSS